VRSKSLRNGVCLPDIHLGAAASVATNTSVGVVGRWLPTLNVGLTVDELQVTRALAVTVTCAVFGTGSIAGVLALATIGVHGNEVQRSVQATTSNYLVREL
jgi:hypothetical protein